MEGETNVRAIFRRGSKLRKPAAVLGMLFVVVAFPLIAAWEARAQLFRELRDLFGVLRS
jgi:hypothetical protein